MAAFSRWLFGDIASVVAPSVDRGPRPPTRRAARWLIGIGLFVTLFGAIGVAAEAGAVLERQDAVVTGRFTTLFVNRPASARFHKVRLRLESGDTKVVTNSPLYDAVGTRTELPVQVDIDPDNNLVDAIYLEGHRYGTGRQSAAVVITILITVLGAFVLLRGIGRLRRARLADAAGQRERRDSNSRPPA